MAAFKAFAVWYPVERLPSLNAAVMVAGGLGALAATTPLAWAAPLLGRDGLFLGLAALAVLAALGIYSTPDRPASIATGTLATQLRELAAVLRSPEYWRYAPMVATGLGGFVALQGLWVVPWLMQVGGQTREAAAFHVLLTTLAMIAGFLGTALLIDPLRRRGVPPAQVMVASNTAGVAAMFGLWWDAGGSHALWFVVGVAFALGNIAYAEITRRFPPTLAGRVNTALNLAAFVGAFSIQWGYGLMLDSLRALGASTVDGHRAAFFTLLMLQAAALGWFLLGPPRRAAPAGARPARLPAQRR
jgi:hypothetical protein